MGFFLALRSGTCADSPRSVTVIEDDKNGYGRRRGHRLGALRVLLLLHQIFGAALFGLSRNGRFSSRPPPQNPGIVATARHQPWRPTAALTPHISFAL